MGLQFGIFDHIEPVPGLSLTQIYHERLRLLERYDAAGFHAYHLAEHHTPAVHSLAPSQNVFLAAASQRTQRLRLAPCIYVLPLHHPLRLIEEICMLDHLSDGRLEIGVGRGGVLEAYFWGQDADVERNQTRYRETLAIIKHGLSHDELTFHGEFYTFDALPMRLRPKQQPYPPMWYMRNVETAAVDAMNTVIVGSLDSFEANVLRYHQLWKEQHGVDARTVQGTVPKIGLVNHIVLAENDAEAIAIAQPA
jgi:alkanesulfonate monooxygenase SsuD/methylene tetrahydromethanopterin reductase-like flavin-dependent oxidoreductase (luciferase family)